MEIIGSTKSKFQHIMLCQVGPSVELVLDGKFQTRLPNNNYYETMLTGIPKDDSVLILGGGDLTAIDVLARAGIEDWDMVEIDEDVVNLCEIYCPHQRRKWDHKVHIQDAFDYLARCGPVDHIAVDLLSLTYFDQLSQTSLREFIKQLAEKANKSVRMYVDAGASGVLSSLVAMPLLKQSGLQPVVLMNNLYEVFIVASFDPQPTLAPQHRKFMINYGASVKDLDFFEFTPEEQLLLVRECS